MSSIKQEKQINKSSKKLGLGRVRDSIKFSVEGLKYAYKNEKSFTLHTMGLTLTIVLGIFFQISLFRWAAVLVSSFAILVTELLNTSIEATVDMTCREYNEKAKIAKDCGSAATLVAVLIHVLIGIFILLDELMIIGLI